VYLDSAIIVKLLVREEDSVWFDRSITGHELWSSELALAEVRSALLIKERGGQITTEERVEAFSAFKALHRDAILRLRPLNVAIVEHAAELLTLCHPEAPLRSPDAIHLATSVLCLPHPLCTTDARLRAAARRIGIPCFPECLEVIVKD
jgi:predicted nucleic acid-binding protein